MTDLCTLAARAIAEGVAAGEYSAAEIVDAVYRRIRDLDGTLHAYCELAEDTAREAAEAIDDRVRSGQLVGPLAGVPVGVKDVLFTKGIRTTGCCSAYDDFVPVEDDVVVARLLAADAIVIGKTTTSELAYGPALSPVCPQAANPWDVSLSPGNSSSGSAAAVASGMAPVAIGTDGGGSIRCPASFCGLYGLKPSRGRVPSFRDARYPGLSSWRSLGTSGPITRTVADAALLLSVMAGPDPRDPSSLPEPNRSELRALESVELTGTRIVWSVDWGYASVDPAVESCFRHGLEVLERDLGATLVEADPDWADPGWVMEALIAADADLRGMRKMRDEQDCFRSPSIEALLAREWSAEDLTTAMAARDELCVKMAAYMEGFDLLVTPTVAALPFPLTDLGPRDGNGELREIPDWCPFTYLMNLTGQPAASVPVGWTAAGLPVGMQIVGGKFDDLSVLRASAAFELAEPWAELWPTVPPLVAAVEGVG